MAEVFQLETPRQNSCWSEIKVAPSTVAVAKVAATVVDGTLQTFNQSPGANLSRRELSLYRPANRWFQPISWSEVIATHPI